MNIACDARALVGPATGVGTWTTQVMGGLARDPGNRIVLAASRPLTLEAPLVQAGVETTPVPRMPWPGTLWLHTALPRHIAESHADVFIGALGVLPRRCPAPGVLVVHDLTPRTHPHRHTLANRFCFNAYHEESLDAAACVVAVSEATATQLLQIFPWARDRLVVIPNGVDPFFGCADADDDGEAIRRRHANGRPFILHLGTLEPRKGLLTLVDAWDELHADAADPPDLVLAGREGWDTGPLHRRISRSRWRSSIHLPGYVSREEARSLMQHAAVFVLASEAEGFGLPLAEAIACGAPCIATDIPSLRETGGDAAVYAQTGDSQGFSEAILEALKPDVRTRLRTLAVAQSKRHGWEPVVRTWSDLLHRVAAERQSVS